MQVYEAHTNWGKNSTSVMDTCFILVFKPHQQVMISDLCVFCGDFLWPGLEMLRYCNVILHLEQYPCFGKLQKLTLTSMFPTDSPMSEQGQSPESTATQEGCLGFQERTNKPAQWDIVRSDSNRDDAERYKKHTD